MSYRIAGIWIALGAFSAFAQTPAKPAFEVASIRPPEPMAPGTGGGGIRIDKAQVRVMNVSIKDLIAISHRVKGYQVSGPDWLAGTRYDIAATFAPNADTKQLPEMFQTLLDERFQVKLHREKKELPVYTLEVARSGLKMKESPEDPNAAKVDPNAPLEISGGGSAQGISVNLGRGSSYTFSNNKFEGTRLTLDALAEQLERYMDRPVINKTGLTGVYDLTLEITPEDYRTMLIRSAIGAGVTLPPEALRLVDAASTRSLYDAFEKLGLKLDNGKAPVEMLVIDEARKTPTEN